MKKSAKKQATLADNRIRNDLGQVMTELYGPEGARRWAGRQLSMENHIAVPHDSIFECCKCGKRAEILSVPGGFELVGEMATGSLCGLNGVVGV